MKKFKVLIIALICGLLTTGCEPTTKTPVDLTLEDPKKNSYIVGDVFDDYINNGGLTVYQNYSDGSTLQLSYKNPHNFNVNIKDGATTVPHSTAFTTAGTFTVTVSTEVLTANYSIVVTGDTPTPPTPEVVHPTSVSLNKTSLSLEVGDTRQLSATVLPENADNKNVTYSSSASTIVSVSSTGLVTAKAKGQATITVKTNDGNKTATCNVTVSENQVPPIVDETITPNEAIILADKAGSGKPTSEEYLVKGIATNVTKSDYGFCGKFKNSKLTFDDVLSGSTGVTNINQLEGKEIVIKGYIELYNLTYKIGYLPKNISPTGNKYNATLISVSNSGSGTEGDDSETIHVTGVTVTPIEKTIKIGQKTTIVATVKPDNAENTNVTWESSDTSVASVLNGEVTAKAAGTTTITAKTVDGNFKATSTIHVEENEQITPISGDNYKISFKSESADSSTSLTSSNFYKEIDSGSSYFTYSSSSSIYAGQNGLKFGSSNKDGELELSVSNTIKELDCYGVTLEVSQYGTKSATGVVYLDNNQVASGSSVDSTISGTLSTPTKVTKVRIKFNDRAYVKSITLICKTATPIDAETISIPSNKDVSINNEVTLPVTFSPSNANQNKNVTWSSNNTAVATVNNGVVKGISEGSAVITATLTNKDYSVSCNVNVSRIAVASISLDITSKTLAINSTLQLNATVLPNNATDKSYSFSSNNNSVASVSQNGLVTAKAVGTATITATTTDGNKIATCLITATEVQKDAWTIMLYVCGADLESDSGLATGDLDEILSVSNQPDDVNIIIQTGGARKWNKDYGISSSSNQRYHVKNKSLIKDADKVYSSYKSMGLSSTFADFVTWGLTEYPAEKTGVILWNHGGGMRGVCYDQKVNDDSLLNSEVKAGIASAFAATGRSTNDKLEFIGYDACLMQAQDIAEFNSQYFKYMIASQESEAGYGWDYDNWIDDVYSKKSTDIILKAIVDSFISDNGGANSRSGDQTLSYLDLSKMSDYKIKFESFASALKTKCGNNVTKDNFYSFMHNNVKFFGGEDDDDEYFGMFDVKDFINKIQSSSSYSLGGTYANDVLTALNSLVVYSVAQKGAGNANGLCCIYSKTSGNWLLDSNYSSTQTNFTNWRSFVSTYGAI